MRTALALCGIILLASSCANGPSHAQEAPVVLDVQAWGDLHDTLHVRWVTGPPTKGQVEYGPTEALGNVQEEDPGCLRGTTNNRDSGVGWAMNHRADIQGITDWPVHLRITGEAREGDAFETDIMVVQAPTRPVGNVEFGTVPITIHPGDWTLDMLPITVGVPFPQGALAHASFVRVMLDGEEIPSQPLVASRWREDHTVKWLRVDLLVPRGAETVTLEYGTWVRAQDREMVVLHTPFELAEEDAAKFPPYLGLLVDAEGKVHVQQVVSAVVERWDPVKLIVRAHGAFVADDGTRLGRFTYRHHVWCGAEGLFRMEFTFENSHTDAEMTSFRLLEFALSDEPVPDEFHVRVGAPDGEQVTLGRGERVLQREDFEWVKEPGDEKGRRLEGVISLNGDSGFHIRNFWQQWPMSVELRDEGLVFGLMPQLPEGFYADRPDEDKLYYNLRDGLHTLRQGVTRTWDIWMSDAPGASFVGEAPCASVPPQWIEDSGALGPLAVAEREQFTGYDEALETGIHNYLAARDRAREYGMMNFGDWHGERRVNWGNLEYDLGHGFLTQYARTGEPAFFRRAEECVRHQRDIDTRHYADDPRRVGQQWTHSIGHTAGYYPREYQDMGVYATPGWSDNRGHIWSQGMLEHYLLGGDRRSWETGLLISDWAAGPQTTNFRFGNAREPGWMTKLVMAAYMATEDPFYLNAARIMLDAVRVQSLATGDRGFFYHILPRGHCNCPDDEQHWGEAGFMLATLMTGMKMYYDVTGDERVADDIVKTARFIVDTMWVPHQMGFRYTSCPETGAGSGSTWILMEGLAFAAARSGDEDLAEICRTALAAAWRNLPTTGKGAGYVICNSAQALAQFAKLPGPNFANHRAEIERALRSPMRRLLPTNVPNPDFEVDIAGWPSRGWATERDTEVKHSGEASLKISGAVSGQNEYVNTTYDTTGHPHEIVWLEPGATYRLTGWLRVDSISEGTPAPSMRLAFRDATGTRGAQSTKAYDLTQLGTWQKLSADMQVPDWNTRVYIALNTNFRERIEVEMHLDDVSLVPLDLADADHYAYHRLAPSAATLTGGATLGEAPRLPGEERLAGPGQAEWRVTLARPGQYALWAKAEQGTQLAAAAINAAALPAPPVPEEDTWVLLGRPELAAGEITVRLPDLPEGLRVGMLVLTDDPSSSF